MGKGHWLWGTNEELSVYISLAMYSLISPSPSLSRHAILDLEWIIFSAGGERIVVIINKYLECSASKGNEIISDNPIRNQHSDECDGRELL